VKIHNKYKVLFGIVILSFLFVLTGCGGGGGGEVNRAWIPRTSGTNSPLYGVTYGNGIFVAVGY
jgi:hypothetical protein